MTDSNAYLLFRGFELVDPELASKSNLSSIRRTFFKIQVTLEGNNFINVHLQNSNFNASDIDHRDKYIQPAN